MPVGSTTDPPPQTPPPSPVTNISFPGYGQISDLGSNWRIKFADADGIPLNMLSFDAIDFGAIAYKEIFQNVKTILATPLYSAALERLLGVDQSIVDLPIGQAAQATIAILDALYFWEPRSQALDVTFDSDVISGHLICALKLNINNVIFGTLTPYVRNQFFETPDRITQELPQQPMEIIEGPPGPAGPAGPPGSSGPMGQRGSLWFTGPSNPIAIAGAQSQDMYLNTSTGNVFQYDGNSWRQLK
jgi:phage baseplate assembly protein W